MAIRKCPSCKILHDFINGSVHRCKCGCIIGYSMHHVQTIYVQNPETIAVCDCLEEVKQEATSENTG